MLNFHWLLEREAVADERSGSLDADTLGYSSSWRSHWPLTGVGSRSGMLNSDWLSGDSFFSSFSGASWAVAGREELLEMH